MAVKIFKISEYDHIAETKQFDAVCDLLKKQFNSINSDAIIIGNYNIEGVELDAMLITIGGIRLLEFKNWGGKIIARENGSWMSDGLIIDGGAGRKSPYEQIRLNRSRATKGLQKYFGVLPQNISAAIIFYKDSDIDDTQLSDTVKSWLRICDNSHLSEMTEGMNGNIFTNDFLESIPAILKIEEFNVNKSSEHNIITNEAYEPEASENYYEALKNAISYKPNFKKIYSLYNDVFQRIINEKTSLTRLNLSGTFAKTDYLLKEFSANKILIRNTNDTRVRLRKYHEYDESNLQELYLEDLRNLCEFIAFIYKTIIPESLSLLFPKKREYHHIPALYKDYMRVIVEQWDEEFVYCKSEDVIEDELIKVCYAKNNLNYKFDWSYLKNFFYKEAQLNLIRPRKEDGVIYPELIIFEPDYLIDISSIARCFTNYADSPYVNLINKLEASETTEPMLLGNLAGQLLDETIHQLPNSHSYRQSALDFYKSNAISLMSIERSETFHQEAKRQKQNIYNAINIALPNDVQRFNSKDGIVEPSFFSEMLGVQGRMDYLQLDYKVLIEQKSGKGDFPYDNFVIPKKKEEHYVQILLYMLLIRYNFAEKYKIIENQFYASLLYSKYQQSLCGISWAPELVFKAIRIRNGIAWTEMMYTLPNGYRILESITPEKLNIKKVSNSLWLNWQRPRISNFLAPINNASDLEKAYYFRFLRFISNEHLLSKLGNKSKDNSGFAAIWHDTLDEKKKAGNIYDNLTLLYPTANTIGKVDRVKLGFNETVDNDMSNFRVGDIVILYPYSKNAIPDARKTIVFRCTIEDVQSDNICLLLRNAQSDNRVFVRDRDKLWAIEHDFMESSYSSLYRGMHAFLSAPKSRRDLLMLQRTPDIDRSLSLKGEYGEFNELMLKVKRANDLFLIIGPPGTGKTSYGLLYTVKEELYEHNSNILLLSYTNRAVDEICGKLNEEGIEYLRFGSELNCSPEYRNNLLSSKVSSCDNIDEIKSIVDNIRIFVGTTTSFNSNLNIFKIKQFNLAVIDEASQILEPHLIGLLSANLNGKLSIKKIVMIGDHKQLPAVVLQKKEMSKVQEPLLQEILLSDCRLSLFERLLKKYRYNEDVTYMLYKQGRMHHDIALFPNYTFYNNKLQEVPRPHQIKDLPEEGLGPNGIDDLLNTRRVVFIATKSSFNSSSDKVNQNEADIIAATVVRIYEINKASFDINETVGVIVPYRNQIATVRNTIDKYGIKKLHDITIDTVERYQGSQRKYIIYGFTVQKYYQLNFLTGNVFEDIDGTVVDRKLNVAMTRAEEHLIMIGNPEILANNFTFFKLIEFVKSKHGYFEINKNDYVEGKFMVPQYDKQELDLSKAIFTTTSQFDVIYNKNVLLPVKEASGDEWPNKVFGYDMGTNLNAIGYGRINFSNQQQMFDELEMNPEKQVLIYCYYIMRQHYCSSRNIYSSYKKWILPKISSVNGRLQFIDIGCGPATCGIAFSEIFKDHAPNMVYTGIDISTAMKNMGAKLLNDLHKGEINFQMKESFNELDDIFWEGCSELPSLVIINISYFFSNVTPAFSERLSMQISEVIKKHPLNQYILIIQHSECDSKLNSYKVFKGNIEEITSIYKQEKSSFSYVLNGGEKSLPFCYDILTN